MILINSCIAIPLHSLNLTGRLDSQEIKNGGVLRRARRLAVSRAIKIPKGEQFRLDREQIANQACRLHLLAAIWAVWPGIGPTIAVLAIMGSQ